MSRYYPVSVELNSDPEVWELTDEFGDRALRIWLEILRIMDAEKNHWRLVKGWDSVISRKVRQTPATVRSAVGWMLARGWLVVRQPSASGPPDARQVSTSRCPDVLGLRNYAKFRKIAAERTPSPNLTEPKLTETNTHIDDELFGPPNGGPVNGVAFHAKELKKNLARTKELSAEMQVSAKELAESWNEIFKGKLPEVTLPLTPSRQDHTRHRIEDHPEAEFWQNVFDHIWGSPFLMGRVDRANHRPFRCTFDWLVKNKENCLKVLEGDYDA